MIAALRAAEAKTERSGGAGIHFPHTPFSSRPVLAFAAAEFRFSLREKRRQLKRCCPCPSRPYAGNNKELPLFLLTKQIKLCIIMLVLVIGF